jgi:hypothetical protein
MSVTGGSEDMGMWVKPASRLKERRSNRKEIEGIAATENMEADAPES